MLTKNIPIELANAGIGVHHAGLHMDDRRAIEELFMAKTIKVVVSTSTLAVGVNLRLCRFSYLFTFPLMSILIAAHTVVIKGVKMFQPGMGQVEYSDLDIMQMMGRAVRVKMDSK